jgi:tRNA pseudouridine38-40 synthase
MKHYFRAIIAYDGTHYFGWQTTKMGPSIQEALTCAIHKATQEEEIPEAASRTDRGVHAERQSIAFSLQKQWEPSRLLRALNAHLPMDIRMKTIDLATEDFHPTIQTASKEYHYRISPQDFQAPIDRLYAWHFPYPLNIDHMKESALLMVGKHDFSAYSTQKGKNPICTLFSVKFTNPERKLQIALKGDRFLYKMARTLAGTLLYVGCGKLTPDCIPSLFSSLDRKKAGVTAPAHGLFLHEVLY